MSKAVKSAKSKSRIISQPPPVLFSMGYLDLIFKLKLTNKDLLKSEEDSKKVEEPENQEEKVNTPDDRYYHIEDLNTIEDLQFLKNKKELWDKISLSGVNDKYRTTKKRRRRKNN